MGVLSENADWFVAFESSFAWEACVEVRSRFNIVEPAANHFPAFDEVGAKMPVSKPSMLALFFLAQ